MMNLLSFIFSNTIVAFIILISIVVFVHELGHFLAGKIFKIQVEEFSIGFGPVAYSFKKGSTLYRINWLPLGGYVRFYGADLEENIPLQNQAKSLLHAKVYKRAIVSFAGPFANFLLSFFIMGVLVWYGIPTQPTIISVLPNSVASLAGLETGDKIIAINHQKMENWPDLVKKISQSANQKLNFSIEREHKNIFLSIIPSSQTSESIYGTQEQSGKIGITPLFSEPSLVPNKGDFFDALGIKSGDKIVALNEIKINYFHEIFKALNKITGANSDALLAHKILTNQLLNTPLTMTVFREKSKPENNTLRPSDLKTAYREHSAKLGDQIKISVDFNSVTLKKWAQKVKIALKPQSNKLQAQNETQNIWSQVTASTDLTLSNLASGSSISAQSMNAWEACGLKPGMTIRGLNQETNITTVTQIYGFFENINQSFNFGATKVNEGKIKSNKPLSIKVKVTEPNGVEKNLVCAISPIQKMDALNKQRTLLEFPFQFVTHPAPLPAVYITANSFIDGLYKSFNYLLNQMLMIYKGLKMLFSGSIPLSNLGGPIAVASIAGEAAKAGFMTFLLTMSLISVNIGMVNLLPLPALDGGALLLYAVEAFYGKPLPKAVQITVQRLGIFIILFLFVLVFYNDILRLIHS